MAIGGPRRIGRASGPALAPRLSRGDVEPSPSSLVGLSPAPATELHTAQTLHVSGSAVADGAGRAELIFDPVPLDVVWLVERIAVANDGVAVSTARAYAGPADGGVNLVERLPNGNEDVADERQPILVPAGARLRIVWLGATAGSTSQARVQYRTAVAAGHGGCRS